MPPRRGIAVFGALALVAVMMTPAGAYPRPGTTERVSVASDGTEGNDESLAPAISADGRYVAFHSDASNLVPGDTNGRADVFVHDRQTGVIERVSVASDGVEGDGQSSGPVISGDGRHVVFHSLASNLVPGDTNNAQDVFVHDRATGATQRVSMASDGAEGNSASFSPAISADGRVVAFHSFASNLVPGDTNSTYDVFVHDRQDGTIERVSVASDGAEGLGPSIVPAISADGRHVAFHSLASNLVPGDTNGTYDVFVHDRETGATERVSVASDGAEGLGPSIAPAISADGRHVAFYSRASNLVPGDTNGTYDVFVHDRETGETERVSVASDGAEGLGPSIAPAISADGRHVAFYSFASNLVPGDENGASDVFVRDRGLATGIGGLTVQGDTNELTVSGWATFSGQTVASASDPPDDGAPGAEKEGAELTGASLTYRTEQEDLLLRLHLASLPGEHCTGIVCERGGGAQGALAPGVLHRRVLYAMGFEAADTAWEVRARSGSTFQTPAGTESDEERFALYRCDPDCTEQVLLAGGIGTTGAEVRVSVPLSALGASEGTALTQIRASTAKEDGALEDREALDEVELPDGSIPFSRVELGIAPADVPEEEVAFTTEASLVDGEFSGSLDVSSLPGGAHRVWARACLGEVCGARSVAVTL